MWYLTDTSYHTGNGLSYAPFQWGQANDVVMTGDWYQNNYDRPILLQKYPNNFQQPPIWSRNRYLYSSPLLNQFSFGGLGQYPLVCNWDADSYDEYVLVD